MNDMKSDNEHKSSARRAHPQVPVSERASKRQGVRAPALTIRHHCGKDKIGIDTPDLKAGLRALMSAVGTDDRKFFDTFISQLVDLGTTKGQAVEEIVNFMLSVVKGIEPRDQLEAMLAAQMAAVHMQTMTFARRLSDARYIEQQDSAERAFNKLARTYATQMEALKRYRTGGEQKVTVEHVTVNEGGQAIVGNVDTGGRGNGKGRR